MEIDTVNKFVNLVKEMRSAQKRAKSTYSENDARDARTLENKVDKVIRDREKRLFEEENSAQGRLFG